MATQEVQRSRTVRAAKGAVAATARAMGQVLHQLWLEVTGVVFLIMALSLGSGAVREYGRYRAGQTSGERVALAVCFTAIFTWFGISSFWRVRKKRRAIQKP